jgi:hypothetical protein
VQITLLLSLWGAALSTLLAILTLFDRTRARPIIRAHARIQLRNASDSPRFMTALVKTGPYDDEFLKEIYAEFRVENHGTKPLSLHHIYVEEGEQGNLVYISPPGLPLVLEGESSATFEIQKEHFDAIDIPTTQRIKSKVNEIGFVDALDRRYPVPKKELSELLDESFDLPTTRKLYARKDNEERKVVAFQTIHNSIIMRRSESRSKGKLPFGLFDIRRIWARLK